MSKTRRCATVRDSHPGSTLASLLPVGVCEIDADGICRFANPAWCELVGRERPGVLGGRWCAGIHPEDLARAEAEWAAARRTGRGFCSEYRVQRPDGSIRWLELTFETLGEVAGGPIGFVAGATDVSERRRSEEELRRMTERLVEAQEIAGMGTWERDAELRPRYWSSTMFEHFGRLPAAGPLPFDELLAMVQEGERTAVLEAYQRLRDTGEPFELEFRIQRPDGEVRQIYAVGRRARDAGDSVSLRGTMLDVTERREVELALRERDAMLRSLYEGSPLMMGIVELVGDDLMYVSQNTATARFFQRTTEEMDHRLAGELGVPQPVVRLWLDRFAEASRTRGPVHFEYGHPRPVGERWLSVTVNPVDLGRRGRPRFAFVIEDATERKRAEELLARQADELARSNRELEQFAYAASHDLQEPLRTVSSFAQLLAERYRGRLDRDADEFIDFVVDGAARMRQLITDLLAYSRVGRTREPHVPVGTGPLLEIVLQDLHAGIVERGAVVECGPLPAVRAIPRQVQQLFQNLVGNALKFTGAEPPRIRIEAEPDGEWWVFAVSDNGIGLEPRHAERIFQIFQRLHTREEYPGTGVGLALCRRIVEQHGGRIWVESAPGRGATFRFTLPAAEGA